MEINKVYCGDCVAIMKTLPDKSIDLVFADPPFNIGMQYDAYEDNLTYEEYIKWSEMWIEQAYRLLKDDGSIYIAMTDEFVAEINLILKKLGFYYRNWIIWYYTFGQHQTRKFSRNHTHILYFSKDKKWYTFNDKDIRLPTAHQITYGRKPANPLGRVPHDVWQIPRVCGNFPERIGNHPCQMPEKILEIIIKASTNEGDLVLDPFGGTGTTAVVAQKLKRNFITIEISQEYCEIIQKRLEGSMEVKRNNKIIKNMQQISF